MSRACVYHPAGIDDGDSDQELLRRYAGGDVAARETLARRHMPLARRLAQRHRQSSAPQEDLQQVAYVGLLKTIDRYDADLGSFIGYAVNTIRGELKRYFRDLGWTMHMTRPIQERCLKVTAAMEKLASTLGRSPTPRDVARETGFTLEEVVEAIEANDAYSPQSLDAPLAPNDVRQVGDVLGRVDPAYEYVELGQSLGPAFRELPARDQTVIHLRFIEDLTQTEIASRLGVSQMHVSRILRRSVDELARAVA